MAELRSLLEAPVQAEEIDHLGHMNVRFYLEKAVHATRVLASAHGLNPEACRQQGAELELHDSFARHYREQLEGAPLAVMGGVLSVQTDGLRFYHELVKAELNERAATFVHALALRQRAKPRRLRRNPLRGSRSRWAHSRRRAAHGRSRIPCARMATRCICLRRRATRSAGACGSDPWARGRKRKKRRAGSRLQKSCRPGC